MKKITISIKLPTEELNLHQKINERTRLYKMFAHKIHKRNLLIPDYKYKLTSSSLFNLINKTGVTQDIEVTYTDDISAILMEIDKCSKQQDDCIRNGVMLISSRWHKQGIADPVKVDDDWVYNAYIHLGAMILIRSVNIWCYAYIYSEVLDILNNR